MNGLGDRDVVGSRPSEAIELVDDDVVDGMLLQICEHPLELWTVRASSRLTTIDELSGDESAQSVRLLSVRLALGRDGEAVSLATFVYLPSSRDTDVRDGR
jgi:hypothetical protein